MYLVLIYLQLVLGATLRHTSNHLISISHIVNGFFVLIHSILLMLKTMGRYEGESRLIRPTLFILISTLVQMLFGMGSFIYKIMLPATSVPSNAKVFFITAHQSVGAVLLAASVFFLLRIYRMEGKIR